MTYTQAQIDKANAVDLEKFLRAQGETLVRSGKEYRWKAHDSLTVCGNKWFRHSQSKGGLPLDFVMEFYGKSFPEAVQMLTGEPGEAQPEADSAPSPAFRLPLRNVTNANILNYLTQERKLSPSLVNFFIAAGDIYEDAAHHNVVFVGRDADGHPRYASSRGIRKKFRQDAAGAEKAFGFAHRGTDKQLLVFEAPIDLLSFIELFPKNWQQHNYLSLGGVSGKALRQFLSERPDVERVFLCLDSDKAGEDACKRLAALLPDTVSVTRIQPCMKDWNDVLVHRAEIPNRNYFKSIVLKEPSKPETVKIIRMSDVELTPVEWLWKPYLPFGKLSVLQGNPGEGKTYFAMHLAAACTNGKLLPNMERMEPFNVIYQTAEDGLGDTVKPRLIEAGADLDRVLVIDDSEVQLTLSDERIEKAIIENNARLVIIDPIQAYLGADVDMNRANEVRPIFMRLGQVAQRTGCAILLIGHLNKAAGMQSLQRGLGSIDIAAAVRSVMFIGKLKHDPSMRILTHEKSSLAPPGVSLAFSLGDEGGFRWVGEYDITADEKVIGSYRGFELSLRFDTFRSEYQALLKGQRKYTVPLGTDPLGNIIRLDNSLNSFPERITAAENELATLHQQQAAAQIEVEKPFPQEEELAEKSARLAELNAQLDVDEKSHEPEQEEEPDEDAPRRPSVLAALEEKSDKPEPVKPFRSYYDKDGDAR